MEGHTAYRQPMTVFWSRAQHQHHVTTSPMKLAVGERNVATNLGIISGCVEEYCFSIYRDSPGPKTSMWWKILVSSCVYCLNCTKFGPLSLRKIIKIVATRCQILRIKCTKFDFGWGSAPAPDPAGGAYSAPADPLAGFKGAYF